LEKKIIRIVLAIAERVEKKIIPIVLVIPLLIIVYFVVVIYYNLNGGTPWGKYAYKKEVEQYINMKYPELDYSIESVDYSFKEMHYSAHVKTSQTEFGATEQEDSGLWDNYPHSIWIKEATALCNKILADHTNEAECRIYLYGSGGLNVVNRPFPSYEEVQKQLYSSMHLDVIFNKDHSEQDYELVLAIKKSIEAKSISDQISFSFNDVAFFDVGKDVQTVADLKKEAYYRERIKVNGQDSSKVSRIPPATKFVNKTLYAIRHGMKTIILNSRSW
jgi:hypothetical protein